MGFFSTLSLKYKILAIAFIGGIGFATYLGYNYKAASANDERLTKIQAVNFPILDRIGKMWLELFAARSAMQTAISEGDGDLVAEAKLHEKK